MAEEVALAFKSGLLGEDPSWPCERATLSALLSLGFVIWWRQCHTPQRTVGRIKWDNVFSGYGAEWLPSKFNFFPWEGFASFLPVNSLFKCQTYKNIDMTSVSLITFPLPIPARSDAAGVLAVRPQYDYQRV